MISSIFPENYARDLAKKKFQFSTFVSSRRHIAGTKKFLSMKFIVCDYVKCKDSVSRDIYVLRSYDSKGIIKNLRDFQNLHSKSMNEHFSLIKLLGGI